MTTRIPTGFCVCVAEGHPELCPNTPGRCAFKCAEYSAGKLKPAYSVPAIQYIAEHRYDPQADECEIVMWRMYAPNDWGFEHAWQ